MTNHLSALAPIERELLENQDKLFSCPKGTEEEIALTIKICADRAFLNERITALRPY